MTKIFIIFVNMIPQLMFHNNETYETKVRLNLYSFVLVADQP
jgi:hypothetical protein